MMELVMKKRDVINSERSFGSFDSRQSYTNRHVVIMNPLDDSRVNANIDEGKY
jgi:hypothetical protein